MENIFLNNGKTENEKIWNKEVLESLMRQDKAQGLYFGEYLDQCRIKAAQEDQLNILHKICVVIFRNPSAINALENKMNEDQRQRFLSWVRMEENTDYGKALEYVVLRYYIAISKEPEQIMKMLKREKALEKLLPSFSFKIKEVVQLTLMHREFWEFSWARKSAEDWIEQNEPIKDFDHSTIFKLLIEGLAHEESIGNRTKNATVKLLFSLISKNVTRNTPQYKKLILKYSVRQIRAMNTMLYDEDKGSSEISTNIYLEFIDNLLSEGNDPDHPFTETEMKLLSVADSWKFERKFRTCDDMEMFIKSLPNTRLSKENWFLVRKIMKSHKDKGMWSNPVGWWRSLLFFDISDPTTREQWKTLSSSEKDYALSNYMYLATSSEEEKSIKQALAKLLPLFAFEADCAETDEKELLKATINLVGQKTSKFLKYGLLPVDFDVLEPFWAIEPNLYRESMDNLRLLLRRWKETGRLIPENMMGYGAFYIAETVSKLFNNKREDAFTEAERKEFLILYIKSVYWYEPYPEIVLKIYRTILSCDWKLSDFMDSESAKIIAEKLIDHPMFRESNRNKELLLQDVISDEEYQNKKEQKKKKAQEEEQLKHLQNFQETLLLFFQESLHNFSNIRSCGYQIANMKAADREFLVEILKNFNLTIGNEDIAIEDFLYEIAWNRESFIESMLILEKQSGVHYFFTDRMAKKLLEEKKRRAAFEAEINTKE